MPDDRDVPAVSPFLQPNRPTPPPPMPTTAGARASSVVTTASVPDVTTKPASRGSWKVDTDQLGQFAWAVERARDRLKEVQDRVDRMRTDAYTPKLGTSPVGMQLEAKFADRLDAPLDNPEHPTTGGLRSMLAEAMRRMDEFVSSAEAAAKAYQAHDTDSSAQVTTENT
jgi:hypothetical protein